MHIVRVPSSGTEFKGKSRIPPKHNLNTYLLEARDDRRRRPSSMEKNQRAETVREA